MSIEAMKQAIEALEVGFMGPNIVKYNEAIKSLLKAIEQAKEQDHVVGTKTWFEDGKVVTQNLYASDIYKDAPQRQWVGLDEEDEIDWEEGGSLRDLVEAVEAKLKEKNHGM